MPADESLSQDPTSATHGDGVSAYTCSTAENPPRAAVWSIDYGYCRTSLDYWPKSYQQGSSDPRCPATCPHKAPVKVAIEFANVYTQKGAAAAAEMARQHREKNG